jgi:hypothetical protein
VGLAGGVLGPKSRFRTLARFALATMACTVYPAPNGPRLHKGFSPYCLTRAQRWPDSAPTPPRKCMWTKIRKGSARLKRKRAAQRFKNAIA